MAFRAVALGCSVKELKTLHKATTNNPIEAYHRVIKHDLGLLGRRRVDSLIHALLTKVVDHYRNKLLEASRNAKVSHAYSWERPESRQEEADAAHNGGGAASGVNNIVPVHNDGTGIDGPTSTEDIGLGGTPEDNVHANERPLLQRQTAESAISHVKDIFSRVVEKMEALALRDEQGAVEDANNLTFYLKRLTVRLGATTGGGGQVRD